MTTPHRVASPAASMSSQLRMIITARGLSAHALARLADVAPSILSRFLNGRRGLTLDTFDRVATALGLSLVELGRRTPPVRPNRTRPRPARPPARVGVAWDLERRPTVLSGAGLDPFTSGVPSPHSGDSVSEPVSASASASAPQEQVENR